MAARLYLCCVLGSDQGGGQIVLIALELKSCEVQKALLVEALEFFSPHMDLFSSLLATIYISYTPHLTADVLIVMLFPFFLFIHFCTALTVIKRGFLRGYNSRQSITTTTTTTQNHLCASQPCRTTETRR